MRESSANRGRIARGVHFDKRSLRVVGKKQERLLAFSLSPLSLRRYRKKEAPYRCPFKVVGTN